MSGIEQDFIHWLDRAAPGGFIPWPGRSAAVAITDLALKKGVTYGRITLWLWQAPNRVKVACAMARIGGDAGERAVRVIHAAPPFQDDDKAQMVLEGERA
jgi:hypothetical protein